LLPLLVRFHVTLHAQPHHRGVDRFHDTDRCLALQAEVVRRRSDRDLPLTFTHRPKTRSQLLEDVWGVHADVTTRTVDTHVKRLREKLGDAGGYVETIRGVGYRFRGKNTD
jgi:DNA-binding response OmpR family regulator